MDRELDGGPRKASDGPRSRGPGLLATRLGGVCLCANAELMAAWAASTGGPVYKCGTNDAGGLWPVGRNQAFAWC